MLKKWPRKFGITISPSFTLPSGDTKWGRLMFEASKPTGTNLKVQVLDASGNLLPDTALPGNRTGFTQPVSLLGVSKNTYPSLRLKGTMTTANGAYTPKLLNWSIGYIR